MIAFLRSLFIRPRAQGAPREQMSEITDAIRARTEIEQRAARFTREARAEVQLQRKIQGDFLDLVFTNRERSE